VEPSTTAAAGAVENATGAPLAQPPPPVSQSLPPVSQPLPASINAGKLQVSTATEQPPEVNKVTQR
jgi:hypothetical protein